MNIKLGKKPAHRWLIGLVVGAVAFVTGSSVYTVFRFGQFRQNSSSQPVKTTQIVRRVTALARLLPESEVIRLSAPLALDGDRVAQLLVKQGDKVQKGQVIAILDSRERLQDSLSESQKKLKLAQAKFAQVKAGSRTGEILAQKANIERVEAQKRFDKMAQEATIKELEAELSNAISEYQRYQKLQTEGAISQSWLDDKRLNVEKARQQLKAGQAILQRIESTGSKEISLARANLLKLTEIRPIDIQLAQAEIEVNQANVKRATTEFEMAYIRAPMTGKILKINTRVGEKISSDGIGDMAQTDSMKAIAEVYQTDIGKIKVGQKAIISSQAFAEKLHGNVEQIGLMVNRQNVFSNQPGENFDRRVVEVKIRLTPEDSQRVSGLTNLQVQVAIQINP